MACLLRLSGIDDAKQIFDALGHMPLATLMNEAEAPTLEGLAFALPIRARCSFRQRTTVYDLVPDAVPAMME